MRWQDIRNAVIQSDKNYLALERTPSSFVALFLTQRRLRRGIKLGSVIPVNVAKMHVVDEETKLQHTKNLDGEVFTENFSHSQVVPSLQTKAGGAASKKTGSVVDYLYLTAQFFRLSRDDKSANLRLLRESREAGKFWPRNFCLVNTAFPQENSQMEIPRFTMTDRSTIDWRHCNFLPTISVETSSKYLRVDLNRQTFEGTWFKIWRHGDRRASILKNRDLSADFLVDD